MLPLSVTGEGEKPEKKYTPRKSVHLQVMANISVAGFFTHLINPQIFLHTFWRTQPAKTWHFILWFTHSLAK